MIRIDEGEEEADRDGLHPLIPQAAHRKPQSLFIKRRNHLALEIDALGHLLGEGLGG